MPVRHRQHWVNLSITGAILGSIISVLAFQTNRLEAYESEKFFLLSAFACVIVGALLLKLLYEPRSLRVLINPVSVGILLILTSTILSTMTSINPVQSIFGSSARSHGALVWIIYAVLFAGATVSARTLRPFAIPTLVMVSIPLCLWAIARRDSDTEFFRNGSTTGNAIFLSSWIIIVLPVFAHELINRHRTRVLTVVIGLSAALMVGTLLSLRSRGALFALMLTLIFCGMFWLAAQKKIGLLLMIALLLGGVFLLFLEIGLSYEQANTAGLNRLLAIEDPFREQTWSQVSTVLHRPTLIDICETPDRFASSRPVVGYGPETVETMGLETINGFFVDRFHNLFYDVRFTHGIIGILVWSVMYLAAVAWALQRMKILRAKFAGIWIATLILSVAAAVYVMQQVLPETLQYAYLPLGIISGLLTHIVGWAYLFASRSETDSHFGHHLAFLAFVIVHLVELQFGFVQMASEALWWILAGMYVGLSSEGNREERFTSTIKAYHWQTATVITGIVAIHSWLNFPPESMLFVEDTWNGFALLMLLLIMGVGTIGAIISLHPSYGAAIQRIFTITGVFLVVVAMKIIAQYYAAELLQQAFSRPELLRYSFILMSLSGVVVIVGVFSSIGLLAETPDRLPRIPVVLLLIVFLTVGTAFYVSNYTRAASHRLATVLAADDEYYRQEITTAAFEGANSFTPPSMRLLMDWLYLDMRRYSTPDYDFDNDHLVNNLQQLHRYNPFHNATTEWGRFAAAGDDNKLYYREYICYPDQEF
ncbi:MAG: hypothetical protein L0154_12010 [Chloroflexi bacterium]|nr:hypothetical protein [Chloroflexota bacterium]